MAANVSGLMPSNRRRTVAGRTPRGRFLADSQIARAGDQPFGAGLIGPQPEGLEPIHYLESIQFLPAHGNSIFRVLPSPASQADISTLRGPDILLCVDNPCSRS